jgi:DNA polymerase-3 subunit chi
MTRIDFYFNSDDRLRTACRIVSKAYRQKLRVIIYAPEDSAARTIDQLLWTIEPTGFIPHCRSTHSIATISPVVITSNEDPPPHDEVLINLAHNPPDSFGRFRRLVEIVSTESSDRESARERFRFYKDRGYLIENHDLSARSPLS